MPSCSRGSYVVDMHHGLIQHNMYVTPYLREQYARRNLGEHVGNTGRIYRIVPDGAPAMTRQFEALYEKCVRARE